MNDIDTDSNCIDEDVHTNGVTEGVDLRDSSPSYVPQNFSHTAAALARISQKIPSTFNLDDYYECGEKDENLSSGGCFWWIRVFVAALAVSFVVIMLWLLERHKLKQMKPAAAAGEEVVTVREKQTSASKMNDVQQKTAEKAVLYESSAIAEEMKTCADQYAAPPFDKNEDESFTDYCIDALISKAQAIMQTKCTVFPMTTIVEACEFHTRTAENQLSENEECVARFETFTDVIHPVLTDDADFVVEKPPPAEFSHLAGLRKSSSPLQPYFNESNCEISFQFKAESVHAKIIVKLINEDERSTVAQAVNVIVPKIPQRLESDTNEKPVQVNITDLDQYYPEPEQLFGRKIVESERERVEDKEEQEKPVNLLRMFKEESEIDFVDKSGGDRPPLIQAARATYKLIERIDESEQSNQKSEQYEIVVQQYGGLDGFGYDETERSEDYDNTTAPEMDTVFEAEIDGQENEDVPEIEETSETKPPTCPDNGNLEEQQHSDSLIFDAQIDVAATIFLRPSFVTTDQREIESESYNVVVSGHKEADKEECSFEIADPLKKMLPDRSKAHTLEAVAEIMRAAGLESSNLIFGIDYTASNKYQGENSFFGKSLHSIEHGLLNPYQQVITILGKTLMPFVGENGFLSAFGFGDVSTTDVSTFPLKPDKFCKSFEEIMDLYNTVTPRVILGGPTNFAPLIYEAINICKEIKDYHILAIVADGQVTNERATRRAIVDACRYPISIIVIGVGDGPWDMMRVFDESLPKRPWDNFHFVEFNQVRLSFVVDSQELSGAESKNFANFDTAFAVQSLLEIPEQYKLIKSMGLLDFENRQRSSEEDR